MRWMILAAMAMAQSLDAMAQDQQALDQPATEPALAAPQAAASSKTSSTSLMEVEQTATAPWLTDEIIKQAVRDTIAEYPRAIGQGADNRGNPGALSGGARDRVDAAFERARVPDCLHADALKLQPAQIGPIGVVGPYSLPWVIAAALRGKCN